MKIIFRYINRGDLKQFVSFGNELCLSKFSDPKSTFNPFYDFLELVHASSASLDVIGLNKFISSLSEHLGLQNRTGLVRLVRELGKAKG